MSDRENPKASRTCPGGFFRLSHWRHNARSAGALSRCEDQRADDSSLREMPGARSPIGAATFDRSPSRETCIGTSRSLVRPPRRASRAAALRDSPPSRPMAAMCARSRLTVTPPLRPAFRASSDDHSCAVPFSWAARPPLLAISRCRMGSIDANPRRLFPVIRPPASGLPDNDTAGGDETKGICHRTSTPR